ncbi:hypothetical protein BC826DRAFT_47465 [Russula brevipes]|nr:hypothetical protein BC826DRAFT_47465 [Russula brevipes]
MGEDTPSASAFQISARALSEFSTRGRYIMMDNAPDESRYASLGEWPAENALLHLGYMSVSTDRLHCSCRGTSRWWMSISAECAPLISGINAPPPGSDGAALLQLRRTHHDRKHIGRPTDSTVRITGNVFSRRHRHFQFAPFFRLERAHRRSPPHPPRHHGACRTFYNTTLDDRRE